MHSHRDDGNELQLISRDDYIALASPDTYTLLHAKSAVKKRRYSSFCPSVSARNASSKINLVFDVAKQNTLMDSSVNMGRFVLLVLHILENTKSAPPAKKNPTIYLTEHCSMAAKSCFVQTASIGHCLYAIDAIGTKHHINQSMGKTYVKLVLHKKIKSVNSAILHFPQAGVGYVKTVHTVIR